IVTQVHNPSDLRLFKLFSTQGYTRRRDMYAAMFRGETNGRPQLIRKVDSRTLIVHTNPREIQNPFAWRGFSIFHGTLRKWLSELQDQPEWVLRYPIDVSVKDQNSRKKPIWNWDNFARTATHIDLSPVFVVHPNLVAYDKEHGLRLLTVPIPGLVDIAALQQEPELSNQSPYANRYELENYASHIKKMLDVYYDQQDDRPGKPKLRLNEQTQLAAVRLEAAGYVQHAALFERAVHLAIALHDVGKLQIEWQDWAHAYQLEIGEAQPREMMIVHTHNKPQEQRHHKEAEEKLKDMKRPPHASESAWASWPIIVRALEGDEWLSRAVFTAIARHHAPFAENITGYQLDAHGQTAIADALKLIGIEPGLAARWRPKATGFVKHGAMLDFLIEESDMRQWLVYALIVRALRLCDGHSLEGDD
ncbi:MAG: hypothetical protein MI924_33815, partial [Chloroflexales bacterium]|nr:hypothetical protein [Chloroflexales bacterium]